MKQSLSTSIVFTLLFYTALSSAETFTGMRESKFEGRQIARFSFKYPGEKFAVKKTKSKTDYVVEIENKKSKAKHTLTLSFEGGRGYTASDYLSELKICPRCQESASKEFVIPRAQNLKRFEDEYDVWILFNPPGKNGLEWLYIFKLSKPAQDLAELLASFRFKDVK